MLQTWYKQIYPQSRVMSGFLMSAMWQQGQLLAKLLPGGSACQRLQLGITSIRLLIQALNGLNRGSSLSLAAFTPQALMLNSAVFFCFCFFSLIFFCLESSLYVHVYSKHAAEQQQQKNAVCQAGHHDSEWNSAACVHFLNCLLWRSAGILTAVEARARRGQKGLGLTHLPIYLFNLQPHCLFTVLRHCCCCPNFVSWFLI